MSDAEELMRRVSAAFEKGDLQPLLDSLHPDVVWKAAATQAGLFLFRRPISSTGWGARCHLADRHELHTFQSFKPREIVAKGDVAWGLFDASIAYKPLDGKDMPKGVDIEIAIRWRLKDGKIIEHQAFFDTASLLIQQGHSIEMLP